VILPTWTRDGTGHGSEVFPTYRQFRFFHNRGFIHNLNMGSGLGAVTTPSGHTVIIGTGVDSVRGDGRSPEDMNYVSCVV
jgi:hypothetical protein